MSSSKPTAKAKAAKRGTTAKAAGKSIAGRRKAMGATRKPAGSGKSAAVPGIASPVDTVSSQMTATAAAIEKAIAASDLESLPVESLQKLMAAVVKAYSAKREAGESFLPVAAAGRVTPTDIMLTSSQLLRAGNLQVFELGMWQSWTGN